MAIDPETLALIAKELSPCAVSNLFTMGVASRNDARQMVPAGYQIPPLHVRVLRLRLIIEEVLEFAKHAGLIVTARNQSDTPLLGADHFNIGESAAGIAAINLEEMIDACQDINYVVTGTMCAMGAADIRHMAEVCKCNDAKFPGGVAIMDEHGKYQKPPGWLKPDHEQFISNHNALNLRLVSELLVSAMAEGNS